MSRPVGTSARGQCVPAGQRCWSSHAPGRWFGPGYAERDPETAAALVEDLRWTDAESYATACEALATYDVRHRLAEVATPVLAVAGDADPATAPALLRHIAGGVQSGRMVLLPGVAHLARPRRPTGSPISSSSSPGTSTRPARPRRGSVPTGCGSAGRCWATSTSTGRWPRTTDLTGDFQDLITGYAWGSIWTRPGLDRRSRSMITLTALVARGHHEELAMHIRAARRNGLSDAEIAEVFLQSAIYCGVPDANTAFRIAAQTLAELDADAQRDEPGRGLMGEHSAFVYDAVRTPFGRFDGALSDIRPDDLAATTLQGLLAKVPGLASRPHRRGGPRQRQRGRRGQPQRRPDGRAARRAPGQRAGHHRQPAVRLQPGRGDDRFADDRDRRRAGRGRPAGSSR